MSDHNIIAIIQQYIEETEPCKLQEKYDVPITDIMALSELCKEKPISGATTAVLYGVARGLRMGREEATVQ